MGRYSQAFPHLECYPRWIWLNDAANISSVHPAQWFPLSWVDRQLDLDLGLHKMLSQSEPMLRHCQSRFITLWKLYRKNILKSGQQLFFFSSSWVFCFLILLVITDRFLQYSKMFGWYLTRGYIVSHQTVHEWGLKKKSRGQSVLWWLFSMI